MAEIDSNYRYLTYEEMGKEVAEKALDEFLYNGKSIREWMQIIVSDDCISRKAVLDGLASIAKAKAKSDAQKSLMGRVMFFMEHLPSVTPQQKVGKWISVENEQMETVGYYCSECDLPMETEQRTKFCPNCGAKMQAESEEVNGNR